MAGKKGENTKKAAGNAKKAEVAAQKQAAADAEKAAQEDAQWSKGAKSNKKQELAAEKAAEAARRKAEKDAQLQEEESALPSKPKGAGTKTATKKPSAGRALDLSQLEGDSSGGQAATLNASGIDNALDALSLTRGGAGADKVERHPEKRFKAAFAAFEERRLEEMRDDKGLRRQQKVEIIRKEFERSPENPFNQGLVGAYDMDKSEVKELREEERRKVEARLAGPS